jgi:pSer/pThr/pTyr-binding forkhead associated (FHA) protein
MLFGFPCQVPLPNFGSVVTQDPVQMFCVLKVIDGPARGTQIRLVADQRVVIGRMSTADFSIETDRHLSRNHFVIEGDGGAFHISDAGSRNGTFVNNTLVRSTVLCSGDIIRAGRSLIQVQLRSDAALTDPEICDEERSEDIAAQIPARTIETSLNPPGSLPHDERSSWSNNDEATLLASVENLSLVSMLLREFTRLSPESPIWQQKAACDLEQWMHLFKLLDRDGIVFHSVINRAQLDSNRLLSLGNSSPGGLIARLSETLWIRRFCDREALRELFTHCWGRDAIIVIATRKSLDARWLEDALDVLSYPSLLTNVVSDSNSRARRLTKGVEYLLFESLPDRKLCLLPGRELSGHLESH